MSITVIQRPIQTISSNDSNWNGVGNPIVYKLQREDFAFNQINDSSGFLQLQINSTDVTSSFNVGDVIYIQSDNGVYDLTTTVTARAFSTNTTITTAAAYVSAAPGGFVNNQNLKPAYRIEVRLYDLDDALITPTVLEYSPNSKGLALIDVSSIIRSFVSPENSADLTTENVHDDTEVYKGFYIGYTEVWQSSAESETQDDSNPVYAVMGALQIPSLYGGNFYEYTAFQTPGGTEILNDTAFNTNWSNQDPGLNNWTLGATDLSVALDQEVSKRARRLLVLESGKRYRINILFTLLDDTVGHDVTLKVFAGGSQEIDFGSFLTTTPQDVTEEFIASGDYTYFEVYADSPTDTNTITISDVIISEVALSKFLTKLDTPVMWEGWPLAISFIKTMEEYYTEINEVEGSLLSAGTIESLRDWVLPDQSDNFTVSIHNADSDRVSELKTIEVREACANPMLLMGRNTLGGLLFWMFDVNQEYTFDYGNGRKAKRLVLYAVDLTINRWESLQDFITLGEVYRNNITEFTSSVNKTSKRIGQQVYKVEQDGSLTGVIVIPTSNTTQTKQIKHTFTLEIEYPEVFVP